LELALFDFDGTISKKDSFIDFLIYTVGVKKFLVGLVALSIPVAKFFLGKISNEQLKEKFLEYFFCGWKLSDFNHRANHYSEKRLPEIVKKEALQRILWHKEQQHQVWIVTASPENWFFHWCSQLDVGLIGTQLAVENELLTGKLATANCYGQEKVRRIRQMLDLSQFSHIYAYGDTKGDLPMLALANEKFYCYFKR
jgi:HAD superfamily hydrolase (TIGR01490 family)